MSERAYNVLFLCTLRARFAAAPNYPTSRLRSKSWDEVAGPDAEPLDFVGTEKERRLPFADTFRMLRNRIGAFVNLPVASLDKLTLQSRLRELGRT